MLFKFLDNRFHESQFSSSGIVICGQTGRCGNSNTRSLGILVAYAFKIIG